MEIKVTYTLALQDYYEADNAFRESQPRQKMDGAILFFLCALSIAFILIESYILAGIIALITFFIWRGGIKRWIVKKQFSKIPHADQEETLIFTQSHIIYQVNDQEELIPWESYADFIETPNQFILFYDTFEHYAVIPKRALSSETDCVALKTLLLQKITEPKEINHD